MKQSVKIGVQGFTLKEKFQELGPYETLKRVNDLGYHAIEISQIEMTPENVAEIKRASHDFQMDIASLSAGLKPVVEGQESLTTHLDKIINDCKTLESDIVRIGMLPFEAMASLDKVLEFCEEANEVAKKMQEHDIKLYYHNHHIEFVKYDGRYLLDIIREKAPLLGFELDVHWIQRGGRNPVEVLKEYKGKVDLVHLKDYRLVPVPQEAVDAIKEGASERFYQAFTNNIQFAELGEGNLDIKAIIEQSIQSGARYLLVEQDDQYGKDPFECLAISRDYLYKLGYKELF
ncbi:sugar phosphate isomerase/epimerase [Jeotgalibaca sp. MA1X17-3]|uniref:sugar phosphate isomerase/epimerase family protein n=1 Tax=Jeotgalibaca sp. MA1X17-3 TaxID=2908211 RepID=UPI001F387129|nr:sugar phosphate isomerase/epimerase [Jeotgalibaca sp. MA1X17-3]UJF16179.1 sugar phosphate isomerase/epimerase [Jeotgalibaca sp. MA1X17-3]